MGYVASGDGTLTLKTPLNTDELDVILKDLEDKGWEVRSNIEDIEKDNNIMVSFCQNWYEDEFLAVLKKWLPLLDADGCNSFYFTGEDSEKWGYSLYEDGKWHYEEGCVTYEDRGAI